MERLDEAKLEKIATEYEVNGREVCYIVSQMLQELCEIANVGPAKIKNAVFCTKLIAQSRDITLTVDLVQEVLDELSVHRQGV